VGASCSFNIVFTPTAATAYSGSLTVAFAGATGTGTPVTLTGTGIPIGILSFTNATNGTLATVLGVRTLAFTIPTPRAPVTSVVTVTNSGTAPLTIGAASLPLNVGGLYSVTANSCSATTVAVGGTCTISIRYATPATRPVLPDIGALSIVNNGATTPAVLALVAQ